MEKKSKFNLVLNTVSQNEDPTLLNVTFIIHDFEKSWNNTIVSKEVALENAYTLKNKPLVCKYYPVVDGNPLTDALGTHEESMGKDRYGDDDIKLDTVPIGVIATEGYILTIEDKEVLAVDGVLWRDRFGDVCDLLLEWHQRGIRIISSVEYLYKNFTFRDGIEYIESPIIYSGHCLLNSEKRGDHDIVLPAYDSSHLLSFNDLKQFNRLVAQAVNQSKEQGGAEIMFKKICELSHDNIRSLLYGLLNDALADEEYCDSWVVEVFNDRFIYQTWVPDVGVKFFEVNYQKTGDQDSLTADFENKVEVVEERNWTKTSENEQLHGELQETKAQLTSLNQLVEELKPYKEKVELEKYTQALNEQIEFYGSKFDAVNAKERFKSDEVQELIKTSLNENEEGKEAKLQLNSILVDLVQPNIVMETEFKESANSRGRLIDVNDSFESRYSIN